ncbi:GAF and ANTAR domain-containing protein [Salinifilum aidingensis]
MTSRDAARSAGPRGSSPVQRVESTTDALDQLLALLEQRQPLRTVLAQLVRSATATIPDTGSATVSILCRDGSAHTAAGSHAWAMELDEQQHRAEDGPCLHAARTGRMVRLETSDEQRWPEFCHAARDNEVAVTVGVPLPLDEDLAATAAALNLTTPHPHAFDPLDEALLELFTNALSAAINHAYRHARARELAEQLGQALEHRDVIGQAKGLLIARHRCSPEQAFDHLRRASQHTNTKLHEVAARLVADESG